jgi:phytanoyl-CoA hydroxylase
MPFVEIPSTACVSRDAPPGEVREAFLKHGFVVIRKFLDEAAVAAARSELARFIGSLPTLLAEGHIPRAEVQHDDASHPSTLKQIQRLHVHDAYFGRLMEEVFKPVAEAALAEPALAQNMQFFNKPPVSAYPPGQSSQPTPPHQDGYYFMIEPMNAATLWCALDPADNDNGAVRYVRDSFLGMRKHDFSGIIGFSQKVVDYNPDEEDELIMAASPGDLIIHHALTLHWAPHNSTADRTRRAIGGIFYGTSAKVDEEALKLRRAEIHRRAAQLPGQSAESVGLATALAHP